MAARRGKTQARRNSSNGVPGWVWLLAGLVLGAALFFIVPTLLKKEGDGFFRPQPNPDAQPAPVADADAAADAEAASDNAPAVDEPKATQYDFYTLLPGKEVQLSDAELAASAREEAARSARAATAASEAAGSAQPTPLPEQVDTTTAQQPAATTTTPAAADPGTSSTSTVVPTAAGTGSSSEARYILQAGAFGGSGDAEATKARIALLGLSARVEAAQIRGKTVYRVRMGPYGSASELAEAKQKLASGGLPAMAIKAQ